MKRLIVLFAAALLAASVSAATPEQLFAAGKQAMGKNEWDKAADFFEQAVKARPDSAEYHFRLGQAYGSQARDASIFRQPGLASKTREEFERAVQLDPNLIDARSALISYYLMAPGFMGGSEDKAFEQAQEIRKRDAIEGHRAVARVYARQKKQDLVRKEYTDAVREQPGSPKAHMYFGAFLISEKNYKQALEEFETSLRLDSNYTPAYFRIGQVAALAESNYPHGEEMLKKYLACTPKEDEPPLHRAWYWLGQIYEKTGRKAEAKQSYATSLRLAPGAKDVTEALKRVS
ncbi:MAG: tetratricopeptide repeat protein [Thermoanaerobaculia bacterium]